VNSLFNLWKCYLSNKAKISSKTLSEKLSMSNTDDLEHAVTEDRSILQTNSLPGRDLPQKFTSRSAVTDIVTISWAHVLPIKWTNHTDLCVCTEKYQPIWAQILTLELLMCMKVRLKSNLTMQRFFWTRRFAALLQFSCGEKSRKTGVAKFLRYKRIQDRCNENYEFYEK